MTTHSPAEAAGASLMATLPTPSLTLDPAPLVKTGRNWTAWAGGAFSVAILAAALWQWSSFDIAGLWKMVPTALAFWPLFVIYYLAGPFFEWLIFRRLWNIPWTGMLPTMRKQVSNELLFGYSGEVYFYAWARRHAKIEGSPFGAVKDTTILSAMVGNVVTLVMVVIAAPLFQPMLAAFSLGLDAQTLAISIGFVLATSLAILAFRRRLFSLPRKELAIISAIHLARIVVTVGLTAWLWHIALPAVALSWWLLLSTWRQLIARLPFIPNKDVVFAALAAFLVGQDREIAELMAMMAALILAAHLAVGMILAVVHFARLEPEE